MTSRPRGVASAQDSMRNSHRQGGDGDPGSLTTTTENRAIVLADDDNLNLVWTAEQALLRADVRSDALALDQLLAPSFHEIGQSGRHWNRGEIIQGLVASSSDESKAINLDERKAEWLGPGLVLLTYRLGFGDSRSRRSSIWKLVAGTPVIVFHQGTAVN